MTSNNMKIIDTHLHVWANTVESPHYPYAEGQRPTESLINQGSTDTVLSQMSQCNVDGALIVQPIGHKFDHSYVSLAIRAHPSKFKGMLLFDPSQSETEALKTLEELTSHGFVGVRFNPYLWPNGVSMSDSSQSSGLAIYKRCGELNLPVGVMCFHGLHLHYEDILNLIQASPNTILILDHFGFTKLDSEVGDENFEKLLSLSKYPNVIVKIAALFRVGGGEIDPYPYENLRKKRFEPLVKAFGPQRLMFGTDYPYVAVQSGEYHGAVEVVNSWASVHGEEAQRAIMGGTAERIFGKWGTESSDTSKVER